MRTWLYRSLGLLMAIAFAACDSYVEDVDNPIDSISDEQLTDESQVPFIITGIQTRHSDVIDQLGVLADGLSDEFIFDDQVPNATFPTFRDLDEGFPTLDNNSVDGVYNLLGELRLFADNLLERAAAITFEDADLQQEALFTGNFYGGLARYYLAAYFGLEPTRGGGVISTDPENPGPFIPSDEMYGLALEKLDAALAQSDAYHRKVINTIIARIHLFQGNDAAARTAAQAGLQEGDAPFDVPYILADANYYWQQAGRARSQYVADPRFNDIVTADPAEAARVPLFDITGANGNPYYGQDKYGDATSTITVAKWQETELMLAEIDLRAGSAGAALDRVNRVRASHGLAPLGSLDMSTLIAERDKEFFATGMRLVDQRRFNLWHLGAGSWQYLPIPDNERNANDNF